MSLNKEIIMLYPKIGLKKNGLVMSMLKRANVFAENGFSVTVLTVGYDAEINLVYLDMIESGVLNDKVKFENIYSFYQRNIITGSKAFVGKYTTDSTEEYSVDKRNNFIFESKNGNKRYEIKRPDESLSYVNIFNSGVVVQRAKYDYSQRLSCMQNVNQGKVESVCYFDVDKSLKIIVRNKFEKDLISIESITLFNKLGFVEAVFSTEQEFFIYTVNNIYSDSSTFYYFIIDRAIYFSDILFNNKKDNYAYIGTIHAAHYNDSNNVNSKINKNYLDYFNGMENLDALVFLTSKQKSEADIRFNSKSISYVVPHVYDKEIKIRTVKSKPLSCISVGRFDPVKRLPELVRIFSLVLNKLPEATLNLYGYGSDLVNIKKAIEDYKVQDSVFICEYTENVDAVYQSADLMLFSSRSEGFGLVIMEALANGCPVVSYDINYGPSDMIESGVNGFLIKDGNVELFAKKVITLLKDRSKINQMRINASHSALKYNRDDFMLRWEKIIQDINNKKEASSL